MPTWSVKMIPYLRIENLKLTVPYPAAHTYITHVWEYTPLPLPPVSENYFERSSNVWHSRETCLLSFCLTAADVFLSAIQSVILLVSLFLVESPTGVDKEVMMDPSTI